MSKDKLISEIARDFNKGMCSDRESVESCTECVGASRYCALYKIATKIYEAGYRFKIYHEVPCTEDDRRVQEIIGIVIQTIEALPSADVVPKSEVEELEKEVERLTHILHSYALQYGTVADKQKVIDKAKAEVAREIFEDIREIIAVVGYFDWEDLCELKREYTEDKG